MKLAYKRAQKEERGHTMANHVTYDGHKSFAELKQVPMDIYTGNVHRAVPVPICSTNHKRQWRKPPSKSSGQQDGTGHVTASGVNAEIPYRQYLRHRSPTDDGYVYTTGDHMTHVNIRKADGACADIPDPEILILSDTTSSMNSNTNAGRHDDSAGMKVSYHSDGEIYVELNGYNYPIDVSTKIDISATNTTTYITGYNHAYTLPPTPPEEDATMETYSVSHGEYLGTTYKRHKQESGKAKSKQKRMQRGCRLWEFIRDLLQSPLYNPSHIKWIDRSVGEFKLIKSNQIARMWGAKKNNDCMTYEKLSRAMRYYYKRKILSPVLGKRLVYRFGANSSGWQSVESRSYGWQA